MLQGSCVNFGETDAPAISKLGLCHKGPSNNATWNNYRTSSIASNDHKFGCPVIYADTIHCADLFIEISTVSDTKKSIH